MASADLLPRGSSPFFFSGLRSVSKILRNDPLLARSRRKPSSSFTSIWKLSTSTDGRRVAPCLPMPEVVSVSSAILPLPDGKSRDNGEGTRWFHRRDAPIPKPAGLGPKCAKSLIFGLLLACFALTRGCHRL